MTINKNTDWKEIKTDNLIALCEMGDEYEKFCKELESLIESKRNKDLIYKVYRIMQGKFTIGNTKYKKFVKKYEKVIEIMKKNHCLSNMTIVKYNPNGKTNKYSTENYFYEYICKHIDDIDVIKKVALKIKQLGFDDIIFGEKLDFTNIEYKLDTLYGGYFEFLENIEVLPTYNSNPIKYKTNGSKYCMTLYRNKTGIIGNYSTKIELNSLIFDPNRLPDEISEKSTIEKIVQQVDNRKKEYEDIKNSVDMSISTRDLIQQFQHTKEIIERIDSAKNKEQLNQILHNISNNIKELEHASLGFQNEIIDNSEKISEEIMETEKKLYLERRKWDEYDFD